jgi:hypothetical protein
MSEDKARIDALKAFMFREQESQELYKNILVVCDLALQIEMSKVMSLNTLGEARIHAAGRMDAINDLLLEFQKLREEALKHRT